MRSVLVRAYLIQVLALLAFLLSGGLAFAGSLNLAQPLMIELNAIVKVSGALHQALVAQNEEQIDLAVRDILWQIDTARSLKSLVKEHERLHLLKILDAAHGHFEQTQLSYGEERRKHVEQGFHQIVNLVRSYNLNKSFGIFYCSRDNSSWVQKTSGKAQNPFRPETHRDCGMLVRN